MVRAKVVRISGIFRIPSHLAWNHVIPLRNPQGTAARRRCSPRCSRAVCDRRSSRCRRSARSCSGLQAHCVRRAARAGWAISKRSSVESKTCQLPPGPSHEFPKQHRWWATHLIHFLPHCHVPSAVDRGHVGRNISLVAACLQPGVRATALRSATAVLISSGTATRFRHGGHSRAA